MTLTCVVVSTVVALVAVARAEKPLNPNKATSLRSRGAFNTAVKQSNNGNSAYTFEEIVIPDTTGVYATDVDNKGRVSGQYIDQDYRYHTFLWYRGELTFLPAVPPETSGPVDMMIAALTDSGILFGNWGSMAKQTAGYYKVRTGEWTVLPQHDPNLPLQFGTRMNNAGVGVGCSCNTTEWGGYAGCVGWVWDGLEYRTITVPSSFTGTIIQGINDRGQMVLTADADIGLEWPVTHSYWVDPGREPVLIVLPQTPESPSTETVSVADVNNRGEAVVGAILDPSDPFSPAFSALYSRPHDTYTVLPEETLPGCVAPSYYGMNDFGVLVGFCFDPDTFSGRGFVAYKK